jgi:hypothetical protein
MTAMRNAGKLVILPVQNKRIIIILIIICIATSLRAARPRDSSSTTGPSKNVFLAHSLLPNGVKLAIHLHLMPRLRIHEAVTPLA